MLDTTMLVRYRPFGEWVNIYYDPQKVSEKQILTRIQNNGCANSRLIRDTQKNTVMNPYIAAGDTLQLRLNLDDNTKIEINDVPKGWVVDEQKAGPYSSGINYINVRTPKSARAGAYTIKIKPEGQAEIKYTATLVKRV